MKPLRKKFSLWVKKQVIPWALPPLAAGFIRLLGMTLTVRVEDPDGVLNNPERDGVLFAFWHNRILMMPYFCETIYRERSLTVMISRSRDGTLIADIAARFGIGAARGSSSKFGGDALRELMSKLKEPGQDVGITPDGPRGPVYKVQPGVIALAQKTGTSILPVTVRYHRKWELKSWDRFQIPRPFTRCQIVVGPAIDPSSPSLKEDLEQRLGT